MALSSTATFYGHYVSHKDHLLRFIFEDLDIRGELVYLNASWQDIQQRGQYSPVVRRQLGEALAAVTLLSATIKMQGSLILQIQGEGPLHTLVAQANQQGEIRGLARTEGPVSDGPLERIFGPARLVMTARTHGAEPHQSVVSLEGERLSDALCRYFNDSEQLRSDFWFFVAEDQVAGLFLQQLPGNESRLDGWERVRTLADTVTHQELMTLPAEDMLHRLFHEERTRLYSPATIRFNCSCSRERIGSSLLAMGRETLEEILDSEGNIAVDCEFCHQHYDFSRENIDALFAIDSPDSRDIIH